MPDSTFGILARYTRERNQLVEGNVTLYHNKCDCAMLRQTYQEELQFPKHAVGHFLSTLEVWNRDNVYHHFHDQKE